MNWCTGSAGEVKRGVTEVEEIRAFPPRSFGPFWAVYERLELAAVGLDGGLAIEGDVDPSAG